MLVVYRKLGTIGSRTVQYQWWVEGRNFTTTSQTRPSTPKNTWSERERPHFLSHFKTHFLFPGDFDG